MLTSLDELLSILKIPFTFYKTSNLNEEVNCTEPASVSVPCSAYLSYHTALYHTILFNSLCEAISLMPGSCYGSFTLATFVSETVGDSDT